MANIGTALRDEITRLSKKTIKQHLQPLQKASAGYRTQIASLKRDVAELRKQLAASKRDTKSAVVVTGDVPTKSRFQARGLRSLRARLAISASDLGKVLGVTGQTIYNWEAGKATPRQAQVEALANIRALGKREVAKRLEAIEK